MGPGIKSPARAKHSSMTPKYFSLFAKKDMTFIQYNYYRQELED